MEHFLTSQLGKEKPAAKPCAGCKKQIEAITTKFGWYQPSYCRECGAKEAAERIAAEAKERMDAARKRLNLSPRFAHATFENFKHAEQPLAYRIAQRYATEYKPKKTQQGLYLYGIAGSGKTHLAAAIGNTLFLDEYVRFITAPELLLQIKKTFDQQRPDDVLERLSGTQLLIIDDIGSEKPTEWVQETLFVLIDRRYTQLRPTIFTSNFSLDQLKDRLGYRIASRIAEISEMVELRPSDYRIRKTK